MCNSGFEGTQADIDRILSTETIRCCAEKIFHFACKGKTNFKINIDLLGNVVDFVVKVILENYSDLKIPLHSRWNHFQVGEVDRLGDLDKKLASLSEEERILSRLDLVIVSVLLDAGAGKNWSYLEKESGHKFFRSEGLAIASFRGFLNGDFSSDPTNPYRVDTARLLNLGVGEISSIFQSTDINLLQGIEGRLHLMRALGETIEKKNEIFGNSNILRPSLCLNYLKSKSNQKKIKASQILKTIQIGFNSIWPGRITINDFNLGDVWYYPVLGNRMSGLVPFHKLSQWLTYSMISPLEDYGFEVFDIDDLTGLAEYRNGGLFIDFGVLELKNLELFKYTHSPGSELIVEWRALTIYLIEKTAKLVWKKLQINKKDFSLGKVLEGGTWRAGREIALKKRRDGSPPLKILSDGTVF